MKVNPTNRKIAIHIAGCVAFLILPFVSSPRSSVFDSWMFGPPEFKGLISSLLLIIFFYVNYYYFIPQYFQKRKYAMWGIITFLCFVLILFIPHAIVDNLDAKFFSEPPDFPKHPKQMGKPHDKMFFRHFMFQESFFRFLVVWGLSFLLKIDKLWKQTRIEKRNAELAYLKSQVNPHFLFNTLNGIYALSLENSQKTPDAIVRLSELMRYVSTEINNDFVPLKNEIRHIENYIELQKVRLGNTVDVSFILNVPDDDLMIAPLILMPFVENAFKHGLSAQISKIKIELRVSDADELIFQIANEKQAIQGSATGSGLENVKRRLELIYGEQSQLNINNTDINFFVELKLKLKR